MLCDLWVLPLTHTSSFGFPKYGHTFPLTGSAVGDEGLAVTVFMDWTLTHVRHTRPKEGRIWFCLRLSSRNEKRFYQKPHTSMVMVGQRNGYVWQATVFGTLTIKLSLSDFSSPVKRPEVHHTVALTKKPRFYLLALPVSPELDFNAAGAQEWSRPARRVMFGANLISLDPPWLCELVHVKLELPVTAYGIVTLVAIVVAAKAAEAPTQMRSSYNLHKTVTIPCDLQTCRKRWRLETKSLLFVTISCKRMISNYQLIFQICGFHLQSLCCYS